jgi:crotonobetainyl-CoA:carnitine CoA-transferase CaiB-like acyl-CoA transferase
LTYLSGIRILDASHVIAGPFATYQLALMGAEVIRVERIEANDFVRKHGGTDAMREAGLGASFVSQNAGKRCIKIDLKAPAGAALFKKLAADSDVVMENFRPGVMDRLGLGYDDIRAVKPDIVYCSLTGYGSVGPLAPAPAYDHIVQGMSGMMSMTGTPESGPLRVGLPITDYVAGMQATSAILAALFRRSATGDGAHIEVSMLASVLSTLGAYAVDYQAAGRQRGLEGNRPFSASPFAGCFPTGDGDLVITANTPEQAERLIAELGCPDMAPLIDLMRSGTRATEEQFASAEKSIAEALAADTAINWERRLGVISVPAGKVRNLAEVLDHPQVAALGCLDTVPVPTGEGPFQVPGLAFREADGGSRELPMPEPAGQSTREILEAAGLKADEIDALYASGAIA